MRPEMDNMTSIPSHVEDQTLQGLTQITLNEDRCSMDSLLLQPQHGMCGSYRRIWNPWCMTVCCNGLDSSRLSECR
jgi:hypothetical protein